MRTDPIPNRALEAIQGQPIDALVPGINAEQTELFAQLAADRVSRETGRLVFQLGAGGQYRGTDGQLVVSDATRLALRGDADYRHWHAVWSEQPNDPDRFKNLQWYTLWFLARTATFSSQADIRPAAPAAQPARRRRVSTTGSYLGV